MTNIVFQQQIEAAKAYEELFVPSVFGQWAPYLMKIANISNGNSVLDVACGTGILAREASARVGDDSQVTGFDISPAMLEVAKEISPGIKWKEGTADQLPFSSNSFDAVVSQFGFMFFPNRGKCLQEIIRVLKKGGHYAIAVWDSLDSMPAIAHEVDLLERYAGAEAADALRAPFILGDKSELFNLADDAGIAPVNIDTLKGTAEFPDIRTLVEADLRGWLPVMDVILEESIIQEILERADLTMKEYTNENGQVMFDISAHVLSGIKF